MADNAFIESFNAIVWMGCLGEHWFMDFPDAQEKVGDRHREYNEVRLAWRNRWQELH